MKQLSVYLAAPFSMKDEIARRALELEANGIKCTSRWVNETLSSNSVLADAKDAYLVEHAQIDLDDIDAADAFVVVTVDPLIPIVRGGRHVESGYALARRKEFMIVGPRENIFHYLPQITQRDTWEDALLTLIEWRNNNVSGTCIK